MMYSRERCKVEASLQLLMVFRINTRSAERKQFTSEKSSRLLCDWPNFMKSLLQGGMDRRVLYTRTVSLGLSRAQRELG